VGVGPVSTLDGDAEECIWKVNAGPEGCGRRENREPAGGQWCGSGDRGKRLGCGTRPKRAKKRATQKTNKNGAFTWKPQGTGGDSLQRINTKSSGGKKTSKENKTGDGRWRKNLKRGFFRGETRCDAKGGKPYGSPEKGKVGAWR